MKYFKSKKITIIILLMALFNLISPTISEAVTADEVGGKLFLPISQFVRFVGDIFIEQLQGFFVMDYTIEDGEEYKIEYSPARIFSDTVPALTIDFFNPRSFYTTLEGSVQYTYMTWIDTWTEPSALANFREL